jgi:sec-independent protein translocase protein TatB
MFDISFTEIMVISVVALIVVGPERLPKLARTLGYLLGRVRHYVGGVKNDIQREMEAEELNELHASVKKAAHTIENSVREEVSELEAAGNINTSTTITPVSQPETTGEETPLTESISSLPSSDSTK